MSAVSFFGGRSPQSLIFVQPPQGHAATKLTQTGGVHLHFLPLMTYRERAQGLAGRDGNNKRGRRRGTRHPDSESYHKAQSGFNECAISPPPPFFLLLHRYAVCVVSSTAYLPGHLQARQPLSIVGAGGMGKQQLSLEQGSSTNKSKKSPRGDWQKDLGGGKGQRRLCSSRQLPSHKTNRRGTGPLGCRDGGRAEPGRNRISGWEKPHCVRDTPAVEMR